MPVAVPAAIAGGQLITGALGAHAANKAAQTQAASADKALELNRQIYQQQRADMMPYVQGGQSAFQTLLNGWQARQGNAAQPAGPSIGNGASPFGAAMGNGAAPGGQYLPQAGAGPMGGNAGAPQAGGQMVTLRAPTGEVQAVPAQHADKLIAMGATRVQ
jgi:hypothetical protein